MKACFEELIGILRAEIDVQEKIMDTLSEQRTILVKSQMDKLETNLDKLEKARFEAEAMDKTRVSKKHGIASRLGIKEGAVTLSEIAEAAEGPQREELLELKDRLTSSAKKIKQFSRQNMLLIRQCIELNNELIQNLLGKKITNLSTYEKSGELKKSADSKMVDTKV